MLTHVRTLLCFAIFLSLPFLAQAQLSKDMQTATQTGSLEYQSVDGGSFFSVLYGINRGKMISDNFMIGSGLSGTVFSGGGTFYGAAIAPYARLYFKSDKSKCKCLCRS